MGLHLGFPCLALLCCFLMGGPKPFGLSVFVPPFFSWGVSNRARTVVVVFYLGVVTPCREVPLLLICFVPWVFSRSTPRDILSLRAVGPGGRQVLRVVRVVRALFDVFEEP